MYLSGRTSSKEDVMPDYRELYLLYAEEPPEVLFLFLVLVREFCEKKRFDAFTCLISWP